MWKPASSTAHFGLLSSAGGPGFLPSRAQGVFERSQAKLLWQSTIAAAVPVPAQGQGRTLGQWPGRAARACARACTVKMAAVRGMGSAQAV